jgi:Acetyl-CoA acetyltransferase
MGETAENLAKQYSISRDEQDEYALRHRNALKLQLNPDASNRKWPLEVEGRRAEKVRFSTDEHPRANTHMKDLAKLSPVFSKREQLPPEILQALLMVPRHSSFSAKMRSNSSEPLRKPGLLTMK